ncbi:MAG: glycosyl transferase family 1 [Acinetobacter sp. GWC1_38_13]|uniref:glycosyltransferase family 4 protein n=1 Tax=Acinetobacter sp. GWC1_38_13 TaxID=1797234 RepID=UPI0008BF5AD5|nr:glycosyltransferase family 4 protein [Acinetobacter sp. GWC1_38_13]OFW44757.1 MAG: glycosyl transferase family 1 [Acinetobacter sp. GWC1_38_13]HAV57111.1 glycosyltransferase family 1 protein [Acinetobacter junii]
MKIIIIGTIASSFYSFRADLIRAMREKQYTVYAFTSEYSDADLKKIESLGAIPVTYELNRGGLNPLADIVATYKLAKKIREIKPDLVFSYFSKPVIFGTIAAKLAKVPRIVGMLEGLGYTFTQQPEGLSKKTELIKKIQVLLYKFALPQLDKLIFLNPDDPLDLLDQHAINVKKVEVLGGIGLNLKDYPYQPVPNIQQPINFLFIGRLLKEKGIHDFLAAVKIVKEKYPETQFTVLGAIDPHNLGALTQSELDELISSNIIDYPGHVDNVKDWIAKSHVFVLPSYREGVPRSTQEAMAIGRAVVTTDVPGCRETVEHGVNGFIVAKWNPEALAEKMIYFIEQPEQIEKMGIESYKIAQEKFDADKVNQRLLNILGL